MKRTFIAAALLVCLFSAKAAPPALDIDLSKIANLAPKGRVQDREDNREIPEVEALIKAGTSAIPFLISKIDDQTLIKAHVIDFWPKCTVGDVAWIILGDFFTTPDWSGSTIKPGLDSLWETSDQGSYAAWQKTIKTYGRKGLRIRAERILKAYDQKLVWDSADRCFRPTNN